MDLVYVPEVLTYGFFRAPQYRDYEQPWNKDYFNYGKSTQIHSQRLPHNGEKLLSKDNCHLCRENKRRSLAAYIRGKARKNSCHEIHEEEEEEEEEKYNKSNNNDSTNLDNNMSNSQVENSNKHLESNNNEKNEKV